MLTTTVEDLESMSAALRALTPFQRAFVRAKVDLGLTDVGAYRAAGGSPKSAKSHACRVARDPRIAAAIAEESKKLLIAGGALAARTMIEICSDKSVKPEVRLRAAEMIANRAGMHVTSEHHHLHTHEQLSEQEMDRRILAIFAKRGIPIDEARKMLVSPHDLEKNALGIYELAPPAPLSDHPHQVARRASRARRHDMTPEEVEADKEQIRLEKAERGRQLYQSYQTETPTEEEDY